jgi:UTP:GlnB (protein PII) uridylyltransferase
VARIGESLDALVRGHANFDEAVRFVRATRSMSHATRVRFESDAEAGTVLTIEAADAPGLLMVIARALYAQDVQIVRSEVTTKDGVIRDRFHLTDLDGGPLKRSRLLEIQTAVLGAIEEGRASGDSLPPDED